MKSYQLQANCYLSKPVQLDAFESLVKSINDFWLTKVKLPQQAPGAMSMKLDQDASFWSKTTPATPVCCARCSTSRARTTPS